MVAANGYTVTLYVSIVSYSTKYIVIESDYEETFTKSYI